MVVAKFFLLFWDKITYNEKERKDATWVEDKGSCYKR